MEYPLPALIPTLMKRWLLFFASQTQTTCAREKAPALFADMHTSFVRIHPFADGNGRMARLLANIPLLASGLPPLLIGAETRREYITLLGAYEQEAGQLTAEGELLPHNATLERLRDFCAAQWQSTWDEIDKAGAVQGKRGVLC